MSKYYTLVSEADAVHMIIVETEKRLKQLDLQWENKEWSGALMQQLAGEDYFTWSFEKVAYAVKKRAKSRTAEMMNEYVLSLKHLPHVKDSFEYAVLFQQTEVLQLLLERHQDNEDLKEWISVYRLLLQCLRGQLTHKEVVTEARHLDVGVKEPMLKLRLRLLAAHSYEQLWQFDEALFLLENSISSFHCLEPCYMKSVLASRALLSIGNSFLYGEGDIERAAVNYLGIVENESTPDTMKADVNHGLGLVMMCKKDSVMCAHYFQEAIFYAKETGKHAYRECLEHEYYPFARNILGEQFDLSGVVHEEQIHQHIVRGEYEKAIRMIEELEQARKSSIPLVWYKGMATGKKEFLWSALEQFEAGNGVFLASLIRRELENPCTDLGSGGGK
ncbi:AimR family lysis-lysogeny pheromone receptor [Shouchella lonarensis]|uniref:Uncharacterized protein n=1 Tax=Shouchella lonarensis TaxID=1464122 RepID=A0A1G6GU70_9BACI|nr:AimR family lysis-lysogeny pheromone receptor [Shouchella lonarensis]SDB85580.1 hypothetical protein SAMN05421737_10230 [Shouchella lonarensis]